MRPMRIPFTTAGQFVAELMIFGLLVSTTSCGPIGTLIGTPTGSLADPSQAFGLFVNTDLASDVLGGIRAKSGESLSLFGKFKDDGSIEELDEIVLADAAGLVTSLQFASGLPSKAVLPDGATVVITYEQATAQRLKGTADVTTADNQQFHTAFDIDLQQALDQLAQTVSDLTQGALQIDTSHGSTSPTARAIGTADLPLGKNTGVRNQHLIGTMLFAATVGAMGFLVLCSMTQMLDALRAVATATSAAVEIIIFSPLILMGELCRLAIIDPIITINVNIEPDYLPHRHHG